MEKRLESIDVLRGFDMFFIMCMDPVPWIWHRYLAPLTYRAVFRYTTHFTARIVHS